ncbi:Cullin-4B [Geranomyces variabilis]|uniref:Cullin-4B n=1 Tax=Geranomyces variabilis TaxID=109894 RepID=A0AAD5TGT5_9FUNG|nr:Cullin-4B [Geranomyces variabilis]
MDAFATSNVAPAPQKKIRMTHSKPNPRSPSTAPATQHGRGGSGQVGHMGKASAALAFAYAPGGTVPAVDHHLAATAAGGAQPALAGQKVPAKKLVIRGFKDKPKVPDNFVETTWARLERAVRAVHASKPVPDSLEELYQACEQICRHKKAEELYAKLKAVCDEHVREEYRKIVSALVSALGMPNDVVMRTSVREDEAGEWETDRTRVCNAVEGIGSCLDRRPAQSSRNLSIDVLTRRFPLISDRPLDDSVLQSVHASWTSFCRQMILIRSIFLYLDRTYVLQSAGLRSLWDMGLDLYRERIMDAALPVRSAVVNALLAQIERERNGEQIDHSTIRSHLRMFVDLAIYFTSFDVSFRAASEHYYSQEGQRMVGGLDLGDGNPAGDGVAKYLKHVDDRLASEAARCAPGTGYLDVGSKKALIATVEEMLITKHAKTLVDRGFVDLAKHDRHADVKRMFILLDRVGELEHLRHAFASYIQTIGLTLVVDPARDSTMVQDLLNFRDRVIALIAASCDDRPAFHNAMKESFEVFINQRQNRPAELIAKFVDAQLKAGKGVTDDELERGLDKALVLFRYIQGKDVFEAFYKKDLAKRLLLQKSTSVDAEKSMLAKLKIECGPGFTSKLEGMFKDIDISRDYMSSFRESSKYAEQLGGITLSVNVLTHGFWPTYTPVPCLIPDQVARCQEVFKEFYMSRYNGRQLTWQHMLGTGVLYCQFDKGAKELAVSTFQALVLLLFNDHSQLTYAEIGTLTNLPPAELLRTLQSLSLGKKHTHHVLRIVNRVATTRGDATLQPTDVFEVNTEFEHNLHRIKINQIQMKETVEERTSTEEGVFQDRQYAVDAAIVRIMKAEKSLCHSMLHATLLKMMKFNITATDFKKRVDSLIDREYIDRDPKSRDTYIYLA